MNELNQQEGLSNPSREGKHSRQTSRSELKEKYKLRDKKDKYSFIPEIDLQLKLNFEENEDEICNKESPPLSK